MATIKLQNGKAILKNGLVSCECCTPATPSINCPIGDCPTPPFTRGVKYDLTYAEALAFRAGGTMSMSVNASLSLTATPFGGVAGSLSSFVNATINQSYLFNSGCGRGNTASPFNVPNGGTYDNAFVRASWGFSLNESQGPNRTYCGVLSYVAWIDDGSLSGRPTIGSAGIVNEGAALYDPALPANDPNQSNVAAIAPSGFNLTFFGITTTHPWATFVNLPDSPAGTASSSFTWSLTWTPSAP